MYEYMYVHAQLLSHIQLLVTPCSSLDSSDHGIFPRVLEWVAISFQGIFLTQGLNLSLLCLLHGQADSLPLSHLGNKHICTYVYIYAI